MNKSIQLSAELKTKIGNFKTIAEEGVEGDVNFVEISSFPLVSLFIVTGGVRSDNTNKRYVHMEFKNQPTSFPTYNLSSISVEMIGYKKYKVLNDGKQDELTFENYSKKFQSTCEDIDAAICTYHGIKCFEDGEASNDTTANVFFYMYVM